MTLTVQVPVTDRPRPPAGEQLSEWGARLDQAVKAIGELPPEQRAVAQDFALALDAVSKAALTTIVRRLRADDRGKELLYELVDDPGVRLLLGMHGIIRLPDPEQAERVRAGIGEDGSAVSSSHSTGDGSNAGGRTFVSLESMFRGPQPQQAHACGCGGGGACGCGGH